MILTIKADGSPHGTTITTEDGRQLPATSVRFSHSGRDALPIVEIELVMPRVDVVGDGKAYIDGREVKRIIYADGGEDEF